MRLEACACYPKFGAVLRISQFIPKRVNSYAENTCLTKHRCIDTMGLRWCHSHLSGYLNSLPSTI